MTINTIHLVHDSYEVTLDPTRIHEMSLRNWRKLVKLGATDWRNEETMQSLGDWFPPAIQDAKEAWDAASQDFAQGWKLGKGHAKENQRLTRAVKGAKRFYERLRKMQTILAEAMPQ